MAFAHCIFRQELCSPSSLALPVLDGGLPQPGHWCGSAVYPCIRFVPLRQLGSPVDGQVRSDGPRRLDCVCPVHCKHSASSDRLHSHRRAGPLLPGQADRRIAADGSGTLCPGQEDSTGLGISWGGAAKLSCGDMCLDDVSNIKVSSNSLPGQ